MSARGSTAGLCALIGVLAFGPLAFGAVEPWAQATLEIAIFGVLAAVGSGDAPLARVLFGLAAFGALQLCRQRPVDAPAGWLPATACPAETEAAVLQCLAWSALAAVVSRIVNDERSLRAAAWTILAVGAAVAFIGLAQAADGRRLLYGWRPVLPIHEFFGPYYDRDHAANLMGMSALTGLGLALGELARLRAERRNAGDLAAGAALALFLAAVTAFALWRTGSRGALQAAVLAATALGWLASSCAGRGRWALRAGLLAALFAYGLFLRAHPRLVGVVAGAADAQTALRLSMWRSGLRMLREGPVLGRGLGAVAASFPYYQDRGLGYFVDHLHNDWLELLVETGVAGLAALGAAAAFTARGFLRAWRGCPASGKLLRAGLFAAAAHFAAHSLVDFSLHIAGNAAMFVTIVACLALDFPRPERPAGGRAARLAQALACAATAFLAARPAVANVLTMRADHAPPERQAALDCEALRWSARTEELFHAATALAVLADAQTGAARAASLREALALCERALACSPADRRYRFLEGVVLWRLGRVHDAARLLAPN